MSWHGVMGEGGGRGRERGVVTQRKRGERWGNQGSKTANPLAAVSANASLSLSLSISLSLSPSLSRQPPPPTRPTPTEEASHFQETNKKKRTSGCTATMTLPCVSKPAIFAADIKKKRHLSKILESQCSSIFLVYGSTDPSKKKKTFIKNSRESVL